MCVEVTSLQQYLFGIFWTQQKLETFPMNTRETPDLFAFTNAAFNPFLTLSWRRSLSYRNPGHERIMECSLYIPPENIKNTSCFIEVFRRHRKGTLTWNGLKENFFSFCTVLRVDKCDKKGRMKIAFVLPLLSQDLPLSVKRKSDEKTKPVENIFKRFFLVVHRSVWKSSFEYLCIYKVNSVEWCLL